MDHQSVADIFKLPPTLLNGFAPYLPYHPYELIIADNDKPKIVIAYDCHSSRRVITERDGVKRVNPDCTHVFAIMFPGQGIQPICASFGAACWVYTFVDGQYPRLNGHLADEAKKTYGVLEGLWPIQKFAHRNLRKPVQGQVTNEEWRFADCFLSVDRTHKQVMHAITLVEEWKRTEQSYILLERNCNYFVDELLKAADFKIPFWLWSAQHYPILNRRIIDSKGKGKLWRSGDMLGQPRAVTKARHMAKMGLLKAAQSVFIPEVTAARAPFPSFTDSDKDMIAQPV